jgi:SAM-dependent methyltransferase
VHKYSILDHNWLALKNNNEDVSKKLYLMKGVVYDLGCGTRPYENDILTTAERYIGVDWSNTFHGQRADIVANLNEPLPIDEGVADTVVSFQVLEHLSEPQTMLNEAFRILRNGGFIYLSVPFQWNVHEAPWDFFRFTCYGLEHLFTKAGFVDIKIEPSSGFWAMWFLKFNYQIIRLVRGPRPLRWLIKSALIPLWWLDQKLAPILDRYWWPSEEETGGYYVTARKP